MSKPPAIHKSPGTFKSPLAAMAASFALGIAIEHSFRAPAALPWAPAMSAVCLLVGLILLRAGWGRVAVCFVLAAMTFTGLADARRWENRFPLNHVRYLPSMGIAVDRPVRLRGQVVSSPYRSGHAWQYEVEAQQIESLGRVRPVVGKIRLRVTGPEADGASGIGGPREIRYGDFIQANVRLRQPHVYQNPGSFDFRRWMEDIEDLYWVGTVKNAKMVERVGHSAGWHFGELVDRARQRLLRGIDDIYPPWSAQWRYGAVLKAVLWGDRTALDSGTIDDFRKTGLYHLLVIAGLHIGLITLLLEFLLRALQCRRVTRAVIVLSFLAVYAFLVEQRAPTLRATLMIALYLIARILDRGHSPLNAIGGVALALLYVRPAWLFESGFQLTFSAALLIVGVAVPVLERTTEPYRRALRRLDDVLLDDRFSPRIAQARLELRAVIHALRSRVGFFERFPALARNIVVAPLKVLLWVANILLFSAVLQLGLLLPMVETFHRVTFAGVGLNALAIPVMTMLLALALPVNLLSVVSPALAAWPAKLLTMIMAGLFEMTHLPGLAGWLSYRIPAPPVWVAWGFCAAFVLAGLSLRYARRAAPAALAACAVFVGLVAVDPFPPGLPRGALELTALDCGQGDSLFVVLPDGSTMLLDAGASRALGPRKGGLPTARWDSGEDIVSPYLWSRGVKRIDVVALTHAGADNPGGLYAVLDNFRIGEFWHPPYPESPEYAALLDTVAEHKIPTRTLIAGDSWSFGGTQLQVLWPRMGSSPIAKPVGSALPASAPAFGAALKRRSVSDHSLVMRISAGGMSFLLPGNVGGDAEKEILASTEPLESQVVKVASRPDKSLPDRNFLARIAPRVALLSSQGAAETAMDSPIEETLHALQETGTRIFRTDTDGATTVAWGDGALVVRTYHGVREEVMKAARPARSSH